MSTFLPKVEDIKREWYVLDAANKPLGRTAALAATLLRGKHKTIFAPNVDCGDHVVIINAAQAVLTGNKLQNKYYRHHSGWVGGLKEIQYATLMKNNPEKAMMIAVKGMLPKGPLGRSLMDNLVVIEGADLQGHEAQKPKAIDINQYK